MDKIEGHSALRERIDFDTSRGNGNIRSTGARHAHCGWFDTPGTLMHIVTGAISGDDRDR